jgi:hypothetical protein
MSPARTSNFKLNGAIIIAASGDPYDHHDYRVGSSPNRSRAIIVIMMIAAAARPGPRAASESAATVTARVITMALAPAPGRSGCQWPGPPA